jgi:hypothetical protein
MDDGRPGPPRSYRDLPIEAMGKTRPTGAEADPAISESSLSALPCPAQIDFATSSPLCRSALRSSFSRMLLRWRSPASLLRGSAHWHCPSPKTSAIQ